jgi:hypothetical protein
MKLTYRGVQYDYNPPLTETQPTEDVGSYRGVDIRFRKTAKTYVHPLKVDLMYRGVAYTTGETEPATADKLRALAMDQELNTQQREQSMLTRLAKGLGLGVA